MLKYTFTLVVLLLGGSILLAQGWKPLEMHGGGKVTGLIFHPTDSDIIYNRTDVAGLNVSTDRGYTWRSLTLNVPKDNPHNFTTRNLAIDPSNPDIMYYSSGNAPSGTGSSIFRSTDAGNSWSRISNPVQFSGNGELRWGDETLIIHPTNTSNLYVGGQPSFSGGAWQNNGGFYFSTDSGTSWTELHAATFSNCWITKIDFHPTDKNLIYISAMIETQSGVNSESMGLWEFNIMDGTLDQLRTDDVVDFEFDAVTHKIIVSRSSGINIYDPVDDTWTATEQPFGYDYGFYIEAHPTQSGRWYFGAFNGFNNSGLLETVDGGLNYNFSKYTAGTNIQKLIFPPYSENNVKVGHGNSMAGLYFHPLDASLAFMDGVWRTADASTNLVSSVNPTDDDDNGQWDWTWVAEGIHIMVTLRVSPHPVDSDRFTVNVADVGQYDTYDGGQDMVFPGLLLHYSAALRYADSNPEIGYVVGEKFDDTGQIRKTTNGGESWFWPMATNFFEDAIVIQDLQIHSQNPEHLVVGVHQDGIPNQIYRSLDGAATWEAWDQGITQSSLFKEWESIDRLLRDDNDVFYVYKGSQLYKRGWNETTWTEINNPSGATINHVKLDKNTPGKLYMCASSGVIWIYDNGVWSSIPSGTSVSELIAVAPDGTLVVMEKLWVNGQRTQKLFIKPSGGSWSPLSFSGFGGTMKNMLFIDNNRLVGTSNGQGANIFYLGENPDCESPWGLYAATVSSNSAEVFWNANTSGNFNLAYREIGAAAWTEVNNVSTPYSLSGLNACTDYEARVSALCGGVESDEITTSFSTLASDIYCPSSPQSTWRYWIDQVVIDDDVVSSQWNGGYKDWSCERSHVIEAGDIMNISVSPGYLDDVKNVLWYGWIDYNQNGIWEVSEQIINTTTPSTAIQNFSITTPTDLDPGLMKMRIIMHRWWTNIGLAACDPYSAGETEDFMIEILGTSDCKLVTSPADTGAGSLRDAIDCANPGDTIMFHSSMFGDTIKFTSALININKDLTILADLADNIYIKGESTGRVLQVNIFKEVFLKGLHIIAGSNNEGRGLYVLGNCTIEDIIFYENPVKKGIGDVILNTGQLTIKNGVEIREE